MTEIPVWLDRILVVAIGAIPWGLAILFLCLVSGRGRRAASKLPPKLK